MPDFIHRISQVKLYQSGDKFFIGPDREGIFPKFVYESGENSAIRLVDAFADKYSQKVMER